MNAIAFVFFSEVARKNGLAIRPGPGSLTPAWFRYYVETFVDAVEDANGERLVRLCGDADPATFGMSLARAARGIGRVDGLLVPTVRFSIILTEDSFDEMRATG